MIKGAIFDLDGTLLDSMSFWENVAALYLKSQGKTADPDLGNILYTMSMLEGAEYLRNQFHLQVSADEIIAGINDTIESFYHHKLELKPGVKNFLSEMKKANIRITAATASDRQIVEPALKRLGIFNFFEAIFTCTEVGAGKTKPDIYIEAALLMETKTDETWVFEDALYALKTAVEAGFRTVAVYDESNKKDWAELVKFSDMQIQQMNNFENFRRQICRQL